jgi:hypothetical protein
MTVYFLHVRDGYRLISDPEGCVFRDLESARSEAIESAREFMAEGQLRDGRIGLDRSIEIWDEAGARLLVVPFRETVTCDGQVAENWF